MTFMGDAKILIGRKSDTIEAPRFLGTMTIAFFHISGTSPRINERLKICARGLQREEVHFFVNS